MTDLKGFSEDTDLIDKKLENQIKVVDDPRVKKFMVLNPQKAGDHIKYTVSGIDDEGDF